MRCVTGASSTGASRWRSTSFSSRPSAKNMACRKSPPFAYGPNGKPFLKDHPGIHFNLSHCPRAALCVVADHPVGCDIEAVPEELDLDLCHHCFNDKEVAAILASDSPTLTLATLWTQKEALLKLTGEGLSDATSHLSPLTSHLSPFTSTHLP